MTIVVFLTEKYDVIDENLLIKLFVNLIKQI